MRGTRKLICSVARVLITSSIKQIGCVSTLFNYLGVNEPYKKKQPPICKRNKKLYTEVKYDVTGPVRTTILSRINTQMFNKTLLGYRSYTTP